VTYDTFMFRNATTASTTWAISADFDGDAIAHVYYGAFDPMTGSAGGTAGGFCLGSSGPGFTLEPFLAEPGALVTVVASPRTAIPGTAYAVTVTAE
jgi:hypothetical protein